MTTLSYLNEPGVLWNLRVRYDQNDIYTYTGSILIAVNPFAAMPHLYGAHMMDQYRGVGLGELSPHVYAVADSAYRQMRREGRSQSILVRDVECGAGGGPGPALDGRRRRDLCRTLARMSPVRPGLVLTPLTSFTPPLPPLLNNHLDCRCLASPERGRQRPAS